MREIVAWTVPLVVSIFLIHSTADFLSQNAQAQQAQRGMSAPAKQTIRGPVHEVDRDITSAGIIT